jgi:hypothetical protein
MGAYEYAFAPTVSKVTAKKVAATRARLSTKVNPNGLATKVRFVATAGKKHVHSAYVSLGGGATAVTSTATLTKLTAKTKYLVVAVAKNASGVTRSKPLKLRTP